ncbi:YDG domain-containing protein [Pedobacter polysacchareus]|uniref:YDG domain-containing protein n=1 Tax=Pedobacter polysacchareus TaxID=2861973 RepID=UPI001C99DB55|nr:YDG domain-containing protein [Pedobacter polysacchareus]
MKILIDKLKWEVLLPLCLLLCISLSSFSQCSLSPGDILFTGYNQLDDNLNGNTRDDSFSFVLLKEVSVGSEIYFTDLGWTGTAFQTAANAPSDAILKWTSDAIYSAGTEIIVYCKFKLVAKDNFGNPKGVITVAQPSYNTAQNLVPIAEQMSLAEFSGDQIFAFTGTIASPNFIAGISINKTPGTPWETTLLSTTYGAELSTLPTTLATASQNLGIAYIDPTDPFSKAAYAARYNREVAGFVGSPSELLAKINLATNWEIKGDGSVFNPLLPNTGILVSPFTIATQPINRTNLCPGTGTSFSVGAPGACSYQWEVTDNNGIFVPITASGGIYTNFNTATLSISNVSTLNQKKFRVRARGSSEAVSELTTLSLVSPIEIAIDPLPTASPNILYTEQIKGVSGGTGTYTYAITAGSLPVGITLNTATGIISGTASTPGLSNFTIKVSDNCVTPNTASQAYSIIVGVLNQTITLIDYLKVYGDVFTLPLNSSAGLPITYVSGTPSVATVTGNQVTVVGVGTSIITATQAGNANYHPATPVTSTITTSKKNITVTLNASPLITKEYDRTNTATLVPSNYTLNGLLPADVITVSATTTYNSMIAGNQTIYVRDFVLSGIQKDNYNLTTISTNVAGTITRKPITVSLNASPGISKVYDNTLTAALLPADYNLAGLIAPDVVSVSGTASYASADAGTEKTLAVTNLTLAGAAQGNYSLTATTASTNTAVITPKPLTVALQSTPIISKIYNNTDAASLVPTNYVINGKLGTDVVTVSGTATYDTKDAGTGKTVTAGNLILAGAQKDNYSISNATASTTGQITPLAISLTLNPVPAIDKVYDGTTAASLLPEHYILAGKLGTDEVSATGTATYGDKNVGTNKTITVGTFVLNGAQNGNYTLSTVTATTGGHAITPASLTLALNASPLISKAYDNTTSAQLVAANYSLNGKITGDAVTVSGTANYETNQVGTGINIASGNFILAGADKDNYNLTTSTASTTGNITKKAITVILNELPLISKTYDNGTAITLAAGNYSLPGVIGTDAVTVTGTAAFDTKAVGTGKNIAVDNFVLAGAQKDNYSLSTLSAATKGNIGTAPLTLVLNASPFISKTYDNNTSATLLPAHYQLSGIIGSELVTVSGAATYDTKDAGTGKAVTAGNFILAGANKDNYHLSTTSAATTGEINTKPITLALNASPLISKVYTGNTDATLAPSNYTLNGVLGGDAVTVSGTASYDSKNSGNGKTITVNNFNLAGAQKDNYRLTTITATTTGNIGVAQLTLTLNALPAITKVYDNNTNAALVPDNYTLNGKIGSDEVTVTGISNYDTKNAGSGKTITVNTFVLGGADKDNYSLLTGTANTTGTISPAAISLSLNSGPLITKIYDNTTVATLTSANYSLAGILGTDAVSVSGQANYSTNIAENGKTITANNFVLAGAQKDNYSLSTTTATTTGNITKKSVSLSLNELPLISKQYDNNTLTSLAAGNYTINGILGSDELSVTGTASYNTKTVGTGKTISVNNFILGGAQKDNYSLTTTIAATKGNISAAPLTLTLNALPLPSKTYDNNTTATLVPANYSLTGIIAADAVTVSGTAAYDTKDAGTGKTVTAGNFILAGADQGNYIMNTLSATTTGEINVKPITLALNASPLITKIYDGNVAATLIPSNYVLTGVLGTDAVTVSGTASYDTKTRGTGKTITANNFALSGAQKDNYLLTTSTAASTGNITASPITLTLNALPAITKVYDNSTIAALVPENYSLSGIIGTDAVTVSGTAAYDSKDAGIGKTITAQTFILGGADKDNYSLSTSSSSTTGSVTPAALTLALNANPLITKTYNNSTSATLVPANYSLNGILGTDAVTVSGQADYDTSTPGIGKNIDATNFVLAGAQKDNYSLTTTSAATTGNITKKAVTLVLNELPLISKEYDNNTSATLAAGNYSLNGTLGSDELSVSGTANYSTKSAGNGKTINVNNFILAGAQKENYSLTTTAASTKGNIGQKTITASLNAAPLINKVYDNNTTANLAPANYSLSGVLGSDIVSVSGTVNYDSKNAGNGKTIHAQNLVLTGADQGNYLLSNTTAATTGDITKFPLSLALNANPLITKEYDKTNSASLSPANFSLIGIKGSDLVSVSGTANYADETAGNGKTINAASFILAGADQSNYSLITSTASTTGNISKKLLTVTAKDQTKYQGTPNPVFTLDYAGFVTAEGVADLSTAPMASTLAQTGSEIGDYEITVAGGLAANYSFSYVKGNLKVLPGAPTSVLLAAVPLYENLASGTKAGTLSATSNNPTATFTYSLVSGSGDIDNGAFSIAGDQLKSNQVFDFESKSSYTIRVRATTQFGLSLDQQFNVSISDVNEAPTLAAIADQTLCYTSTSQNIPLTGISAGPETTQKTTLSYTNSNTNLLQNLSINQTGATGNFSYRIKNGAYGTATITVTVKDNGGLENGGVDTYTRSFVITVNPLPLITIQANLGNISGNSTEVSKGETVALTATGGNTYTWSPTSSILNNTANISTIMVRPTETTTYTVTVTNANGCSETSTFTVKVLDDLVKIKATNILSPNGDGYNDKWIIENIDVYPNNEVKIFDKAGRQIYSKRGYDNTWDGTLNGTALSEGTYYYVIDFGNNRPKFKGFITIVREN